MSEARKEDLWKTRIDREEQPEREPGPINLQRYQRQRAFMGAHTFLKLPVCLTPEDLAAGNVDVAVLGAPVDFSSGIRGASRGPLAIRTAQNYIRAPADYINHLSVRVRPLEVLTVVDYGDAAVDHYNPDNSMEPIRELVGEVVELGIIPVVLGGDHSILWPDAGALIDVYGAENLGLIHLDAHADCGKEKPGMTINHSLAIPRLIKDEGLPGKNIYQIGLRGFYPDEEMIQWMRQNGINSHFMAEIDRIGLQTVLDNVIRKAQAGPEYFYVSFDIDVLDPAFAPGTGTPEPGGLLIREAFSAVRRICHELNVVGFEIVEVAPTNDSNYVTALNAHRIVIEAITGIAMRRTGIEDPNYLDPVTSGETPFPL